MNQPLIKPWQDPEQEAFYAPRLEDQHITVKLSREATERTWERYRLGGRFYMLYTFDGEVWDRGSEETTYVQAVAECLQHKIFAFGMVRRRAWRLIWHGEREERKLDNFRFESVELMGYKGLSDQWKDRPKVKLFANDI